MGDVAVFATSAGKSFHPDSTSAAGFVFHSNGFQYGDGIALGFFTDSTTGNPAMQLFLGGLLHEFMQMVMCKYLENARVTKKAGYADLIAHPVQEYASADAALHGGWLVTGKVNVTDLVQHVDVSVYWVNDATISACKQARVPAGCCLELYRVSPPSSNGNVFNDCSQVSVSKCQD